MHNSGVINWTHSIVVQELKMLMILIQSRLREIKTFLSVDVWDYSRSSLD